MIVDSFDGLQLLCTGGSSSATPIEMFIVIVVCEPLMFEMETFVLPPE